METMITDYVERDIQREMSVEAGKKWLEGVSDINEFLEEATSRETHIVSATSRPLKDRVLFCQYASAGDILMTTKCLKGLKERHNLPLDYMTQERFIDILTNNPDIDNIIPWDHDKAKEYKYVYNPHQERILPGHWGRNSNSLLSDFYWRLLEVKNNGFFIDSVQPDGKIVEAILSADRPVVIVYTTGGDPLFRTYRFMHVICAALKDRFLTVQLGGQNDHCAGAEIDLRGLTYRQEAWIVQFSKFGIAVDTFGAHLLGAFGKSLIMLPGSSNHYVVRPDMINGANVICVAPDYIKYCEGLGPCSGSVKTCPMPCMGRINPNEILSAFERLERMEHDR
jgi:hypothetical protein